VFEKRTCFQFYSRAVVLTAYCWHGNDSWHDKQKNDPQLLELCDE